MDTSEFCLDWTAEDERRISAPIALIRDESAAAGPKQQVLMRKINALNKILKIDTRRALAAAFLVQRFYTLVAGIREAATPSCGRAEATYGRMATIYSLFYAVVQDLQLNQEMVGFQGQRIILQELMCICRGLDLDRHWREQRSCPSTDEYLAMIRQRSCSLYRFLIRTMQLYSSEDVDISSIGDNLGLIHRLRMDMTRLEAPSEDALSDVYNEFVLSRLTLPLVHSFNMDSSSAALNEIIQSKDPCKDPAILAAARMQMKKTGSFEYTRIIIAQLEKATRQAFEKLSLRGYEVSALVEMLDKLLLLTYSEFIEIYRASYFGGSKEVSTS